MSASANSPNTENESAVPCANNCGFWGRPSTGNYCSACYKQKIGNVKEKENSKQTSGQSKDVTVVQTDTGAVKIEIEKKDDSISKPSKEIVVPSEKEEESKVEVEKPKEKEDKPEEKVERKVQKNRMRCFACRKKIGLTGTECRCGYVFCGDHRFPEEHSCDFDFHSLAKQKVSKKSSSAMAEKLTGEKL